MSYINANSASIDTTKQIALTMAKATGIEPLSVLTSLKCETNLLRSVNNVTFLYDPNWEYEAGNPTYPIAFFHIKSLTESMSADISQKPLLFYNSSSEGDGTSSGVLNIISDNIITRPKLYKMDILIPANSSTFNSIDVNYNIIEGAEYLRGAYAGVKQLLKGLYGNAVSVNSVCNMLLQQQDYNKASLEFMWKNRRIIAFKTWNSWKLKYLVIQNFEVTKIGENGDYYEGSLLLQEVPILTFRNQQKTSLGFMSNMSYTIGEAQKLAVKAFITTMSATLGE